MNHGLGKLWVAAVLTCALGSACGSATENRIPSHEATEAGAAGENGEAGAAHGASGGSSGGPSHAGGAAGESGEPEAGTGGTAEPSDGGAGGVPLLGAGGDADAGEAGQGGSGTPCIGQEPLCATSTTLVTCNHGFQSSFQCTNGCVESACAQTNLATGWVLYDFDVPDDSGPASSYTFSQNGLSALETENAKPSVYYLDRVLENVDITGSFSVETTSDDDFIGFVFGWQDPSHFYLLDWKKGTQSDGACGDAQMGVSLKVVDSDTPIAACHNFWHSAGTEQTKPLVTTASNPTGWVSNTVYTFHLSHRPGKIAIEIHSEATLVASLTSNDATYSSGKFGFYTYSQADSRFQFFQVAPAQ